MSRHAATGHAASGHRARRARDNRKLALAALVVSGGLIVTAGGVYAGLNAVASNGTAQQVSSGTLELTYADNGAGFAQSISDIAPGDTVNRSVDLTNGGTLDASALTLSVSDSSPTKLTTDNSVGLRLTVTSCPSAWTMASGGPTCGSSSIVDILNGVTGATGTVVVDDVALADMGSTAAQPLADPVAKGAVYHYLFSLTLPDQDETTKNGVLPSGTIQGLTANLTWTFNEAQRAVTTTTS